MFFLSAKQGSGKNVWSTRTAPQLKSLAKSVMTAQAMEAYEDLDLYEMKNGKDGERIAKIRLEVIESDAKSFLGDSFNPFIVPGKTFVLDIKQKAPDEFGFKARLTF